MRNDLGGQGSSGPESLRVGRAARATMEGVERIARRIAAIRESATLAVDAKAKALKAAGENVIGFGAGEPDFPTPAPVVAAAVAACRDPRFHHYSPTPGLPELREAIAHKTKRDSGVDCVASQVLVTNGGKHAVYNTFQVLCDPGDEVLLPAPYWTSYPECVTIAGGVPVVLPTTEATGFRVTLEQLDRAVTARTKALLFVSPSNPTGAVYPAEEVEAIGRWALERGIWVVTDEIYEHLTYDGHVFSSMPGLVPELADRCVILNGVAKTYAMTGWRVGWMVGPRDVIDAATNLQSHSTSNVGNVAQAAALAAVSGDLSAVAEMRAAFARRGRAMYELLAAVPGVQVLPPQGAFYCFPSFEGVLGREIAGRTPPDTLALCELLLDEAKVALVPGEAFGAPGYARLSFALGDDDLREGVRRIAALLGG
jgi:aspartate/methionine/tyrosine aminotransferase